MCAKVISISYTCWATYNTNTKYKYNSYFYCAPYSLTDGALQKSANNNQKTTPGQEVHKFYSFQELFLAYWRFQKYQTKVANFAPRMGGPTAECFQLQGASPPEPLTRGSAPGLRWGLCPRTPVIGSGSALAMSPTRVFCPHHCFRPGDAPGQRLGTKQSFYRLG